MRGSTSRYDQQGSSSRTTLPLQLFPSSQTIDLTGNNNINDVTTNTQHHLPLTSQFSGGVYPNQNDNSTHLSSNAQLLAPPMPLEDLLKSHVSNHALCVSLICCLYEQKIISA